MFNIFEGTPEERACVLQRRLEILKRAREDGFFDEKVIAPMPSIVADGVGPDDEKPEAFRRPMGCQPQPVKPPTEYDTTLACIDCQRSTTHHTYGCGYPVWHCNVCCTCDLCMQRLQKEGAA